MFLLPKPLKNVHRIFEGQKLYLQDLLKCSAYVNNNTLHGYYICKCVMHCMIACPSPLRFSICVEAYGMKKVQLEVQQGKGLTNYFFSCHGFVVGVVEDYQGNCAADLTFFSLSRPLKNFPTNFLTSISYHHAIGSSTTQKFYHWLHIQDTHPNLLVFAFTSTAPEQSGKTIKV